MHFDILITTMDSHLSLLTVMGKWLLLAKGNLLHKCLRNAGFCLTARTGGNDVSFGPDTSTRDGTQVLMLV